MPEFYLIHEEVVKPSMLMQYESTTREMLTAFTEMNADPKVLAMNLYTTTDFHYVYVVPIPNFGGIDAINQGFMTMAQAIGKDRYNDFVVMRRPDLSYVPATPRVPQSDVRFVHWAFYYLDAARGAGRHRTGGVHLVIPGAVGARGIRGRRRTTTRIPRSLRGPE